MKKKVILGIVAVVVILALAVPAFAATLSDAKKKEINALNNQVAELRKKIIDEYVEAGVITDEQGVQIKKNIDNAAKYQQDNGNYPGLGCGGGSAMMSGYGMMNGNYNTDNVSVESALGQAI